MATKQRPIDLGTERGRRLVRESGERDREARRDHDLSLAVVGEAVGLSAAQISRIERGHIGHVSVLNLARLHAVVGLDLAVTAFPAGAPIRDVAHVTLIEDFCARLHPSLGWTTEVPMPQPGDPRAWDLVVRGEDWRTAVEAETGPRDGQGLARRIALKQRDSGIESVVLLLRSTVQTRRFLQDAGRHIGGAFPVAGVDALERLGAGRAPGGNAIVVLPFAKRKAAA